MNFILFIAILSLACLLNSKYVNCEQEDSNEVFVLKKLIEITEGIKDIQHKLQVLDEKYEVLLKNSQRQDGDQKLSTQKKQLEDYSEQQLSGISYHDNNYVYNNIHINHFADQPQFCITNKTGERECSNLTLPHSCKDASLIHCRNNICRIRNPFKKSETMLVTCERITDTGGAWTVVQRRINNLTDFNRTWSEYKNGFGDIEGNYWIGLDNWYAFANMYAGAELYIRLKHFDNSESYATCGISIQNEEEKYVISAKCRGPLGNLFNYHWYRIGDRCEFSLDLAQGEGGWWQCGLKGNLNSVYHTTNGRGIILRDDNDIPYEFQYVEMMVRPYDK